jgi:hypothetical protein
MANSIQSLEMEELHHTLGHLNARGGLAIFGLLEINNELRNCLQELSGEVDVAVDGALGLQNELR